MMSNYQQNNEEIDAGVLCKYCYSKLTVTEKESIYFLTELSQGLISNLICKKCQTSNLFQFDKIALNEIYRNI